MYIYMYAYTSISHIGKVGGGPRILTPHKVSEHYLLTNQNKHKYSHYQPMTALFLIITDIV